MASLLSPSDSDHWESRRFPACDRCRNQKLRCLRERRRNPSSPCSRCQRAQTDCVVSLRERPGRRSGKRCDREQSTIPIQAENTELHPALPPGQHWESNVDESWFNIIGAIEGNIAPTPESPYDSVRDTSLEANASIGFDFPSPDGGFDPLDPSALDFNSDERHTSNAPMLLYPKGIGLRDAYSDERTNPGARLFQIPHKLSMQLQDFNRDHGTSRYTSNWNIHLVMRRNGVPPNPEKTMLS